MNSWAFSRTQSCILLAADLSIAVSLLGWESVLVVLALMLVVRPINILASTWNRGLTGDNNSFLSWVAPRGIVAANSVIILNLSTSKVSVAAMHSKLWCFLPFSSRLCSGLTAGWVASWLGLRTNQVRTVVCGQSSVRAIVGARLLRQKEKRSR